VSRLFPALADLWKEWDGKQSLRTEIEQGDKILGTTFSTLPEDQGTLILFSDITRIKELENRVKQMEKLASLGELAAGLAHELKNPLAGIKASLQLLQHDSLSEAHRDRLHQVLERDIQRLDRLVTDFLAFARPAKANRHQVKLQEVISNTIFGLQEDNPDVAMEIDPSFYERAWYWDADQLHQVLLNLLMNAIQAARDEESPNIHISLHENESGEFISIVDNGPGIDPGLQSHIFDPFVTSKKGGSGLGLAIAQRLASQNSSWIELKNRPGTGTEARIHYQEPQEGSEPEKAE
jgi:signal transduction histidine kinase